MGRLKRTRITVEITVEQLNQLENLAEQAGGFSLSYLVRECLRRALHNERFPGGWKGPQRAWSRARQYRGLGHTLEEIKTVLNKEKYRTSNGDLWQVDSVSRLLSDKRSKVK